MHNENNSNDSTQRSDQEWADLLSPSRRKLLVNTGIGAAVASAGLSASALAAAPAPPPIVRSPDTTPDGRLIALPPHEPWGYETQKEPATRPLSVRPGEQALPENRVPTPTSRATTRTSTSTRTATKSRAVAQVGGRAFPGGAGQLEPGAARPARDAVVLLRLHQRPGAHPGAVAATQQPGPDHPVASQYRRWPRRPSPLRAVGQSFTAGQRLQLAPKPKDGSPEPLEKIYPNIQPTLPIEV